jgi:starch-binding outer membrane protein, SusD/RagB family
MIKNNRYPRKVLLMPLLVVTGLILFLNGCNLDVANPNAPSEEQVLTTPEGIVNLATGLFRYHSTTFLEAHIVFRGTTAHELSIITTLANLIQLEEGGTALPSNISNVLAVWTRAFRVIEMSNQLIENAGNVTLVEGTRSGILSLAHLLKGNALGSLGESFEQAPLDVDPSMRAEFRSRSDVLAEAIRLLENALQIINATPPSSEFRSRIVGTEFDLENTIRAYLARYHLLAGNYNEAISAADNVSLETISVFRYDDENRNPVYNQVYALNYFRPRALFGSPVTDENDARLDFYLGAERETASTFGRTVHELEGFFGSSSTPIPTYLPGEMLLIKAESHARLNQLQSAVNYINAVRTKTAQDDPYGLGAALPEYAGPQTQEALLTEIYRQRTAELFLTGLRWEDSRRFNRPGPLDPEPERNRNFYPYPDQERINNPNTPPNPNV